jgi:asparagine synthetase B (glutamine-hydrolysing)
MTADKKYCMSSFLMFRTIAEEGKTFREGIVPRIYHSDHERIPVSTSVELEQILRGQVARATAHGEAALALSGGIDSAILAKFMPKGSVAYTFQCRVPGVEVTNEVPVAARYAAECGLEHRVVEIFWEDFEDCAPLLMKEKGAPIHSIEVQIYKAACKAKNDGFSALIFGESADATFGGHDKLLSRDWTLEEFIERYAYVLPHGVLCEPEMIVQPFRLCEKEGKMDVHKFMSERYYVESMGSYQNACDAAGIQFCAPYSHTCLNGPLDYERVRTGNSKYLVRELFEQLYPGWAVPEKIPMPRPMNEWLKDWAGPTRPEFCAGCIEGMNGDQKWLIRALEIYLNMIDGE